MVEGATTITSDETKKVKKVGKNKFLSKFNKKNEVSSLLPKEQKKRTDVIKMMKVKKPEPPPKPEPIILKQFVADS